MTYNFIFKKIIGAYFSAFVLFHYALSWFNKSRENFCFNFLVEINDKVIS